MDSRQSSGGPVRVGVLLTLFSLYRQRAGDAVAGFREQWRRILAPAFKGWAEAAFSEMAHTREEVAAQCKALADAGAEALLVVPTAYTPSGEVAAGLAECSLPLIIFSSARDVTLPTDIDDGGLIANQGVHAAMDLANTLWRSGRPHSLLAGHVSQAGFVGRLRNACRAAAGANFLRNGRGGRLGGSLEGMLDFTFDAEVQREKLGFAVEEIGGEALADAARVAPDSDVRLCAEWARERFQVDDGLEDAELSATARWSLGLERLVAERSLDAVGMNFLEVGRQEGVAMPFLGADRLMARGVGYAGEGDVLTAMLVAAMARACGPATFTEWFCADYARESILLSHMGECNYEMADPSVPVRLAAKPFKWGGGIRLAVPVFQLRPGVATVACLTQTPRTAQGEMGFRMVVGKVDIAPAALHPNLRNPYSRAKVGGPVDEFLETYGRAGGIHHVALAFGDQRRRLAAMSELCGVECVDTQRNQ